MNWLNRLFTTEDTHTAKRPLTFSAQMAHRLMVLEERIEQHDQQLAVLQSRKRRTRKSAQPNNQDEL